jgi:hypothetical protein
VPALMLLTGCPEMKEPRQVTWVERLVPTTDAERKAVQEYAEKIMLSAPDGTRHLVAKQAHEIACAAVCRPTLWEHSATVLPQGKPLPTGKWRYAEETK